MKEWKKWLTAGICCLYPWTAGAVDVQVRDVPTRTVLEGLARAGLVDDEPPRRHLGRSLAGHC